MINQRLLSDWGKIINVDDLKYSFQWDLNKIDKKAVSDRDIENFIQAFIFNSLSYYFKKSPIALIELKRLLIKGLDLPILENDDVIFFTGSGQFGFSLSPKKNFKVFNESSDLDCFIISEKLFMSLEKTMRVWSEDIRTWERDSYEYSVRNEKKGFFQSNQLSNRYKNVINILRVEESIVEFINNLIQQGYIEHNKLLRKKFSIRIYKNKYQAMSQIKFNLQDLINRSS